MKNFWINYHHLNYFKIIAREGSISKAAVKLKLGQSTLSAQLKQFEENIGVKLFEHQHKKLSLTEEGIIALEYAEEIFKLGDELLEVLHDKLKSSRPHLQIGALDSIPKDIMLALAKEAQKIGRCTVSFLEGDGEELLNQMAEHKIDLIISNHIPRLTSDHKIYSRLITQVPVSIFGAKNFIKFKSNYPKSLEGCTFVLPTGHSKLRHDFEHFINTKKINIDIAVETQDTELLKILGTEGIGLVVLNHWAAKNYIKEKKLIEIGKLPGVFEDIYLLSRSRKIENPISSELMKNFKLEVPD